MAPERIDPEQRRYAAFCEEYRAAWQAAGKPSSAKVLEIFTSSLGNAEPVDVTLYPLWDFMKAEHAKNTCLTWFSQGPLRMLHQNTQSGTFVSSMSPHLEAIGMKIARMFRDAEDSPPDDKN